VEEEEGEGEGDASSSRRRESGNDDDDDLRRRRQRQDSALDRASRIRQWSGELELARYNVSVRERVDELLLLQQQQQRALDDRGMAHGDAELQLLGQTVRMLLHELDLATVLPRALQRDDEGTAFWNDTLPTTIKHSTALARLLLGLDEDRFPLPIMFQKMLWMDPTCPLRKDRDVLMASLEKGLDSAHVTIHWSREMANDRELVLKCLERCPRCIWVDKDISRFGLSRAVLQDTGLLRELAFSTRTGDFASVWRMFRNAEDDGHAVVTADPELMADVVVGAVVGEVATDRHDRLNPVLGKNFPAQVPAYMQPLLDNVDFAVHLAAGFARHRHSGTIVHLLCPVPYWALSHRVQLTPQVALAFLRLDGSDARHLPIELGDSPDAWAELWKAATDNCPEAIYAPCFLARPCPELVSRDLALRLLMALDPDETYRVFDFRELFVDFPPEIKADREINKWLVLSTAGLPRAGLSCLVAAEWARDRDFWTELAEMHQCPTTRWNMVPRKFRRDPSVVLVWARRARPDGGVGWLEDAADNSPQLGLLSDRQVLRNWIPESCRDEARGGGGGRRIALACLDRSVWLEVFATARPLDCLNCVPEALRHDPEIVDAHLRWCAKEGILFLQHYDKLPLATQHQFAHRLVEALLLSSHLTYLTDVDTYYVNPELLRIPDVAYAAITRGWGPRCASFSSIVKSSPWSNDPTFLLSVAELWCATNGTFWECCSDELRRDKGFMLRLLKLDRVPRLDMTEELERDFDIRLVRFELARPSRDYCWTPSDLERELAATVRARLGDYLALEAFVSGVSARPRSSAAADQDDDGRLSASPAVTLLGQDRYTLEGLTNRLAECLGLPLSHEEAARLRRVSNEFTKYGY
jgi:hypothetical protein